MQCIKRLLRLGGKTNRNGLVINHQKMENSKRNVHVHHGFFKPMMSCFVQPTVHNLKLLNIQSYTQRKTVPSHKGEAGSLF